MPVAVVELRESLRKAQRFVIQIQGASVPTGMWFVRGLCHGTGMRRREYDLL